LDTLTYGNPKLFPKIAVNEIRFIADITMAMVRLKQAFDGTESGTGEQVSCLSRGIKVPIRWP
jgi:hypothetical protein